ncbi:anticodon-binding domain-containing protein [Dipodascopsis uninucleata]
MSRSNAGSTGSGATTASSSYHQGGRGGPNNSGSNSYNNNSGSSRYNNGPQSTDWTIGLQVKLTTTLDDVVVGNIYSYCTLTNTIVVEEIEEGSEASESRDESIKNKKKNYRLLKISFIKDVQVIGKSSVTSDTSSGSGTSNNSSSAFAKAVPSISPVSIASANQRLNSAIRSANQAIVQEGVGVTKEAQELFNALVKTLPCRWADKSIIVLDEVRIDPPYTSESCKSKNPSSPALIRIKRVVEGERKRLQERKGG